MEAAAKLSLYLHQNFIQISLAIKSSPLFRQIYEDKPNIQIKPPTLVKNLKIL
jgi:hypothetical protein